MEMLFEIMMDEYIERHSAKKRIERRKRRGKKRSGGGKRSEKKSEASEAEPGAESNPDSSARSRHIPQAIRDEVFVRDGGRCTFIGPDGKRCDSTWDLEVDHIEPFAKGGDNTSENLRLLCARHNILEAERAYGAGHMKKFCRRE